MTQAGRAFRDLHGDSHPHHDSPGFLPSDLQGRPSQRIAPLAEFGEHRGNLADSQLLPGRKSSGEVRQLRTETALQQQLSRCIEHRNVIHTLGLAERPESLLDPGPPILAGSSCRFQIQRQHSGIRFRPAPSELLQPIHDGGYLPTDRLQGTAKPFIQGAVDQTVGKQKQEADRQQRQAQRAADHLGFELGPQLVGPPLQVKFQNAAKQNEPEDHQAEENNGG